MRGGGSHTPSSLSCANARIAWTTPLDGLPLANPSAACSGMSTADRPSTPPWSHCLSL